ncbi:MarR family winged helix-turn-helix transcriptional regulator [Xylanimonas protaetiae]|uniref:MarR family transcriptional regulator n=1 Tax=Xylanimonas protaetiae TaxID=2509457 RepID=A0A4P6F714_9MICO|nr:MarR family transcriptional regulator [Xylanimonas protaetiae]QAY71265.1 MarR family transcriptional regulator [Xylanimonas protaetiae]
MQQLRPGADLAGELLTTVERVVRLLREISAAGGLSATTVSVLSRLERSGPSRLTELAVASGVTQPAMSQLVARLDHEGLVARSATPEDKRVVLIEITDHGRTVLESRRVERRTALADVLALVPDDDQRAIAAALPALDRLLTAAADERGDGPHVRQAPATPQHDSHHEGDPS